MSDVNLTDTEREALCICPEVAVNGEPLSGAQLMNMCQAHEREVAKIIAERVADARAAALAPIQALHTQIVRDAEAAKQNNRVVPTDGGFDVPEAWLAGLVRHTADRFLAAADGIEPAGPPSTPDEARTGAGVCWRSECRTGCYYPGVCSLKTAAAAGVDAAPNETKCAGVGRCAEFDHGHRVYEAQVRAAAPDETTTEAPYVEATIVCAGCRAAVPSGHEQDGDHRG